MSVQAGANYTFGSNDLNVYRGVSALGNTVYWGFSTQSGFYAGYAFGMTPYSGFPVSSNFFSVGVNYNVTHNTWSGNLSAWSMDQNGVRFNPSFSMMVFAEQTTNLFRAGKFMNNNELLDYYVKNGKQQLAIKKFGFKGEYIGGEGQSSSWVRSKDEYGIRYTDQAFHSYNALYSAYMKESFHLSQYFKNGGFKSAQVIDGEAYQRFKFMPEERDGTIYLYENRGLFAGDEYKYFQAIRNVEGIMNNCNEWGYYVPAYNFAPYQVPWYDFFRGIHRRW